MKEDGLYIISDPGRDKPEEERKTFQCCHCGAHFSPGDKYRTVVRDLLIAGADAREIMKVMGYGYCQKCDAPYCGRRSCNPDCMIHHQHFMERIEQNENDEYKRNQAGLFVPSQITIGK